MIPHIVPVLIGFTGAIVVIYVMVCWWSEGVLSGGEMLAYSTIYGGLVFGVFASVGRGGLVWVALVLLVGSVGWVISCNQKESLRSYYREKIKAYEVSIRHDPTNTAARSAMAEAYYLLGDLDKAIGSLEIAGEKGRLDSKDNHRLVDWCKQRELRDSKTVVCHKCSACNIWGATQCWVCNSVIDYAGRTLWDNLVDSRQNVRFLAAVAVWLVALIVSLILLPPVQTGIVTGCFTLTIAGWLMLSSRQ